LLRRKEEKLKGRQDLVKHLVGEFRQIYILVNAHNKINKIGDLPIKKLE